MSIDAQRRQMAGRIGVVAAVLVFVTAYLYGLTTYGIFLGIALGWLPCGVVAWLAAFAVTALITMVTPCLVAVWQRLSPLLQAIKLN